MAELVTSSDQLITNINTLHRYRNGNKSERKFHDGRIKNGKLFVALEIGQRYLFAPSKFAGHKENDIRHEHELNERDGRSTTKVLTDILGSPLQQNDDLYDILDRNFLSYCSETSIKPSQHHKPRRYWLIKNSTDPTVTSEEKRVGGAIEVDEGEPEDRTITFRKRNAAIIQTCKERDRYTCRACGFYLKVGANYIIDCHHQIPLGNNKNSKITKLDDLLCLCPTCHRIAHTRTPEPLGIDQIRAVRNSSTA